MIVTLFLPCKIKVSFCCSLYSTGISVLSIIFGLFFASLVVIISSPDNKFIKFLEKEGYYTELLLTFKITLFILFLSLIFSIVLYLYSDFQQKSIGENALMTRSGFLFFVFLFSYSLASTAISVKDTIAFCKYRIDFVKSEEKTINSSLKKK